MRYTFGTNTTALQRLGKLAEVFNPHSRKFIGDHLRRPVRSAVDLGCGPGFTTQMLSSAVRSAEVYGIDNSEEFLAEAMELCSGCVFVRHDLMRTPFPLGAEVMYARFILAHLPDPVELADRWADELHAGGSLFLEETEDIKTDIDVFKRYLEVSRGLVASQGATLYAGRELAAGRYRADVAVNECADVPVQNRNAAAMFYPNTVSVWENEEYVRDRVSAGERKDISGRLFEIMNSRDESSDITWKMRRVVLMKSDPTVWLFI